MATIVKLWDNGDELTLVTSGSGISISSAQNLTGSTRQKTIRIQTTDGGLYQDIVINQGIQSAVQDGYWVHKDTGVKTYFGLEDSSIENGIMSSPSWMPNCSEVKLPSGITGFKTYNWVFEELDNMEITYTGFVYTKETIMTGNDALVAVDLSNTSITSLGSNCFTLCTSLTSITLPESVLSLGFQCLYACSSLSSITLPESVTIIGEASFAECNSLILVTVLPATPPSMGLGVFSNVHSSLSIKVPSSSVNAYKAATNWINYASKISAI